MSSEAWGSQSQPRSSCSAHILRVNPCPGACWAARSHVSSPHSSVGPLKWVHPPGALRTTKTTNTGLSSLLSETHWCMHAHTHAQGQQPVHLCGKTIIKTIMLYMQGLEYNLWWTFFTLLLLIWIPRQLWEGNVREGITFQTWHTLLSIRTEIKARPLPTTAHPQQSLQSAPIVRPRPITDNGSPPKMPPRRPNRPRTQRHSPLTNTRDTLHFTQSTGLKEIEDDMEFFFLLRFDWYQALYCHKPSQSEQDAGACSTKTRKNRQVPESPFQFFDIFCWSSIERDLAPSWTCSLFFWEERLHTSVTALNSSLCYSAT